MIEISLKTELDILRIYKTYKETKNDECLLNLLKIDGNIIMIYEFLKILKESGKLIPDFKFPDENRTIESQYNITDIGVRRIKIIKNERFKKSLFFWAQIVFYLFSTLALIRTLFSHCCKF